MSQADTWERKSLKDATAQILARDGIRLLSSADRFLSCLMDLTDNESSEMRVLTRNCDDEFLAPLVEASKKETASAINTAAHRMMCILRDERGISGSRASDVAWALASGYAQCAGVAGIVRPASSKTAPRAEGGASSHSEGRPSSMGTVLTDNTMSGISGGYPSQGASGQVPSYGPNSSQQMPQQPYQTSSQQMPQQPYQTSSQQMPQQPYQTPSQGYMGMPSQGNTQMSPQGYVVYGQQPPQRNRPTALLVAAVLLAAVAGVVLALFLSGSLGPKGGGTVETSSTTTSKSDGDNASITTDSSDEKDEKSSDEKDVESSDNDKQESTTTESTSSEKQEPVTTTTTAEPAPESTDTTAQQQTQQTATTPSYVLAQSNSRYYSYDELNALDNWTLYLGRNEIYARYGRMFANQDLRDYFNSQSWYNGYIEPSYFDDSVFNDYERTNVQTIKSIEESRGSIYLLPQDQR